ncbi:hypothetical protein SAICODRAFT_99067 [Saitoella complicata NRRL Y-17804]|nr:uncharacterized protein SAICODRAFT_99067 [Saitoella complicata NRRL Y-17804]ODQ55963.1 hypothetical protein SAICODRAFT_99067 [Saitoella complicata NRRL Y-17804]
MDMTFHTELSGDSRMHQRWAEKCVYPTPRSHRAKGWSKLRDDYLSQYRYSRPVAGHELYSALFLYQIATILV